MRGLYGGRSAVSSFRQFLRRPYGQLAGGAAEAAVDVPPLASADSVEVQKGLVFTVEVGAVESTNLKRASDWIKKIKHDNLHH